MRMIFAAWDYNGQEGAVRAFERLGYRVSRIAIDQAGNITDDPEIAGRLSTLIEACLREQDPCRFVFSHDYFPVISDVCQRFSVPYLSHVYDSPHYSLTSPTTGNAVNRIHVFDRGLLEELEAGGTGNLRHTLLSVDPDLAGQAKRYDGQPYEHEVSFIGSLYRDRYTFYDQIEGLPQTLREYMDLAFAAQRKIFGVDLLGNPELVPDKIIDALGGHVHFDLNGDYRMEPRMLLRDILRKKVTSLERAEILARLGERFPVDLYTTPGTETPSGVRNLGYASYDREMPRVFRRSRVNINITLRTIRTGIPQRALDIMACGGFLLSDYREELAEFFSEGEELVLARTPEDFLRLTEYYLAHDKEREEIARNGQRRVLENYTHDSVFRKMTGELAGD